VSIANYLTFTRIFISPIFLLIYIIHDDIGISSVALPYILIFLMGVSELSDAFDGYFARKYNQVTDLGKLLDPMADSVYRISIFLSFTQPPVNLPILLVFIFIYRDSVISTLRTVCALRGYALAARMSGKLKAIFQAIVGFMVLLMMIPHSMGYLTSVDLRYYSTWIVSIVAAYALFSGLDYIYANRHYLKKLLTLPERQA
jgi:CDP-diacylglycerol---glycerol-3-phosphate 3-phosphatidyltransferase